MGGREILEDMARKLGENARTMRREEIMRYIIDQYGFMAAMRVQLYCNRPRLVIALIIVAVFGFSQLIKTFT